MAHRGRKKVGAVREQPPPQDASTTLPGPVMPRETLRPIAGQAAAGAVMLLAVLVVAYWIALILVACASVAALLTLGRLAARGAAAVRSITLRR